MFQQQRWGPSLMCILIISILLLTSITIPFISLTDAELERTAAEEPGIDGGEIARGSRATKPTGNGPYTTTYVFDTIPRINASGVPARIYYPTSGGGAVSSNGAPFHGVVFAPGAGGTETAYVDWLSTIASWGYIVTIVGTGGPCNQEVVDIQSYVVDYYEILNANATSIFYNKINASACGASGHSNGGWAAIAGAVADTRFAAVCPLAAAAGPNYGSGQANTRNLHVPLQLVSGADDSTYLPSSDAYYSLANPIKSYMKVVGSGHGGPFNLEYLVSFFKFWLNGDDEYCTFIYGDELDKDINNGIILFTSDVGLDIASAVSKTVVYEDENITFTAAGSVVTPNPPDRTITGYQWDFDADGTYDWDSVTPGSTKHNFEQNGEYNVAFRIKDSWGMAARKDYTIYVNNKEPTINAGLDIDAEEDEVIQFDITGVDDTASDMAGLLYMWEFGDGNQTTWSSDSQADHDYNDQGEYSVKVSVKDDDGAIAVDTLQVTVTNVEPVADFTVNKTVLRINEPVLVDASTSLDTPSDEPILTYKWNFGDSGTGAGITANHSYADEGNYTISLTVEDDDAEQGTASKLITVQNRAPVCTAMDDITVFEDDTVSFSGTGYDSKSDEAALEFSWDLGIAGVADTVWDDTAEFEYQYTEAGVYTATLTVRDDNGAIGTDSVKITVMNVKPEADFSVSADEVNEDELIKFNAGRTTDTESDMETLNYTWDLDESGLVMYGKTIQYSYSKAGKYVVSLTVTDDDGSSCEVVKKITVVNTKPSAVILVSALESEPDRVIEFSAVQVQDTESDMDGLVFKWDFGDTTPQLTGMTKNHSYSAPGSYVVSLTVEDDDGESNTYRVSVKIIEVEVIDTPEPVEAGDGIDLTVLILTIVILLVVLVVLLFLIMRKKGKGPKPVEGEVVQPEMEMPGYEQYPPQQSWLAEPGVSPYDQTALTTPQPLPALPAAGQADMVDRNAQTGTFGPMQDLQGEDIQPAFGPSEGGYPAEPQAGPTYVGSAIDPEHPGAGVIAIHPETHVEIVQELAAAILCETCGRQIPVGATSCPGCGAESSYN